VDRGGDEKAAAAVDDEGAVVVRHIGGGGGGIDEEQRKQEQERQGEQPTGGGGHGWSRRAVEWRCVHGAAAAAVEIGCSGGGIARVKGRARRRAVENGGGLRCARRLINYGTAAGDRCSVRGIGCAGLSVSLGTVCRGCRATASFTSSGLQSPDFAGFTVANKKRGHAAG
jgi:hypothetical protein